MNDLTDKICKAYWTTCKNLFIEFDEGKNHFGRCYYFESDMTNIYKLLVDIYSNPFKDAVGNINNFF